MKLNLGCGLNPLNGWVNVDKIRLPGVDVVHDSNKFPYPFDDNTAEYILMKSVLEHLDDVIKVMEEIHRILKPNGKVEIIVPYYKHRNAFTDPTHKHFFTERSMDYFFRNSCAFDFYTKVKFKCMKFEKYRGQGFPFWHLKKYFGINIGQNIKLPLFPSTLRWLLEVIK